MAEPLKHQFGIEVPRRLAAEIARAFPAFPRAAFLRDVSSGYDALELMPRARHIARTLRPHLPAAFPEALRILLASLGPVEEWAEGSGMAPFYYLPHTLFVAEFGLDHLDASLAAQHELTRRFSAEFSLRPFLDRHPAATLARLREWAADPSPHVRRLVSEGTRPRLPWAPRLRAFQRDPAPVLELLELLKDDPDLYVRRSVANNLNDIGKDHPAVLVETARRWRRGATPERDWVIRHALRFAVKRGDRAALEVLGFGGKSTVKLAGTALTPQRVRSGGSVTIAVTLKNPEKDRQSALVDLRVHFVKASGRTAPKVFKLKVVDLEPRGTVEITKKISLREMTTRQHFPGTHRVEVLINGVAHPGGSFDLV